MKIRPGKDAVRLAVTAIAVPILAGTLSLAGYSAEEPEYCVVKNGREITLLEGSEFSTEDAARLCGYEPEDYLYEVTEDSGYTAIELYRALDVSVTADGETRPVRVSGGTVGNILADIGVSVGDEDILSHSPETAVEDGMEIRIRRVTYGEDTCEEAIPHGKTYVDSKDLNKGTEKTKEEGKDGVRRLNYRVKYIDGVEVERELLSQETVTEPVNTVILRGTKVKTVTPSKPATSSGNTSSGNTSSGSGQTTSKNSHTVSDQPGTVTTPSGEVLSYSKSLNIKAAAYSYNAGSITASGAPVQVGIVAMLRSTLPQGTRVYVVTLDGKYTYGPAVVGDVPGSDIVDLFFETVEECRQFGTRQAIVYVLS